MAKAISVNRARQLGEDHGLLGLAVISVLPDGRYGITTWGKTRHECAMMKRVGDDLNDMIQEEVLEFPVGWALGPGGAGC